MKEKNYKQLHDEFKVAYKAIKKAERIVIFRHSIPDFDALGTQMGLYHWIKESFPEKEVHFVGDINRSFIPRLFPKPEVLEESFFDKPYTSIILDTGNKERIAAFEDRNCAYTIRFDHHPMVEKWGDAVSVHTDMASSAELVALFIQAVAADTHPISKTAARCFFIGMVGDSGRFMYPETSPMSFRLAADLLQTGINFTQIYMDMYHESLQDFNFKKWVFGNFKMSDKGTFYYVINDKTLKELGLVPGEGKVPLGAFRNVEGVKALVSVTEDIEKGIYRLSFRSACKPVSKIATKYEGGGHLFAAGGKLHDIKQLPELIADLDALDEVATDAND